MPSRGQGPAAVVFCTEIPERSSWLLLLCLLFVCYCYHDEYSCVRFETTPRLRSAITVYTVGVRLHILALSGLTKVSDTSWYDILVSRFRVRTSRANLCY